MIRASILAMLLATSAVFAAAAPAAPAIVDLGGILNADSDDTPAFTPDGNTVFFDRTSGSHKSVMVAHRINGRWAAPEIAPFSGQGYDQNPVVSPDGSFLIFDSDRPIGRTGHSLVQTFFGKPNPGSKKSWCFSTAAPRILIKPLQAPSGCSPNRLQATTRP